MSSEPTPPAPDLNDFLRTLHDRVAMLEANPPRLSESIKPAPKVPVPDKFDGNIAKYRDFMASIKNYFALQGNRYATDEMKVRFIGTLFTGDPLTWFRSLIESESQCLINLGLFLTEFKANYDDPHVQKNAQANLRRLRQAKGSVLSYASKFRRLASETGFNAEAKVSLFRNGLNDDVKDVLATVLEEPSDFEGFMNFCIKIDHRLYDRRIERRDKQASSSQGQQHPSERPHPKPESVPMDLDAIGSSKRHNKLTKEERQRRFTENLCLYCGEGGHRLSSCPKKSKN